MGKYFKSFSSFGQLTCQKFPFVPRILRLSSHFEGIATVSSYGKSHLFKSHSQIQILYRTIKTILISLLLSIWLFWKFNAFSLLMVRTESWTILNKLDCVTPTPTVYRVIFYHCDNYYCKDQVRSSESVELYLVFKAVCYKYAWATLSLKK